MTVITVYDSDARRLQRVAEDNDMTIADIIDLLTEYIDDMKTESNLI